MIAQHPWLVATYCVAVVVFLAVVYRRIGEFDDAAEEMERRRRQE